MISTPNLLFLGNAPDRRAAKIATGIRNWRPDFAVLRLRALGCGGDMNLPDTSLDEALEAGARTLAIFVADRGGVISAAWRHVRAASLLQGGDLVFGLNDRLSDEPELAEIARGEGRALQDVRVPSVDHPLANGGLHCLVVGTDCSVDKNHAAPAMDAEIRARGMRASVRATGQTGIRVTGGEVPPDAVVADFISGAAEWPTPDNDDDYRDPIEGQGSLFHASYSGVSLALVHGGQPDALILCHEPTREHMRGLPDCRRPWPEEPRDLSLQPAEQVKPDVRVAGISVTAQHPSAEAADGCLAGIETRMGLPAVDPFRNRAAHFVDALEAF